MMKVKLSPGFFIMLFIAFTTINSCKQKTPEDGEKEALINAIDHIKVNEKFSWVVVLPGLGCPGCIQEGELFVKDHLKNKDILFVLTKISSLKILQQKIGLKVEGQPNVLVDSNDIFEVPTDNKIYPIIITVDKGKLINYEFQSPKNGAAFDKLNRLISQNK